MFNAKFRRCLRRSLSKEQIFVESAFYIALLLSPLIINTPANDKYYDTIWKTAYCGFKDQWKAVVSSVWHNDYNTWQMINRTHKQSHFMKQCIAPIITFILQIILPNSFSALINLIAAFILFIQRCTLKMHWATVVNPSSFV